MDIIFEDVREMDEKVAVMKRFEQYKTTVLKDSMFIYTQPELCARMYDWCEVIEESPVTQVVCRKLTEWMEEVDRVIEDPAYKQFKETIRKVAKLVTENEIRYDVPSDSFMEYDEPTDCDTEV